MAKRVLILEENQTLAGELELKLRAQGYETVVVADGLHGFDRVRLEKFDLVFLDMFLPDISGFEFLKKLKDVPGAPPVIVLATVGQEKDKHLALSYGAASYYAMSDTTLATLAERARELTGGI